MILCVEASVRDSNAHSQAGNLAAYELSVDPIEAGQHVRRFLAHGYWVEVFNGENKELVAGPFNPDLPPLQYIV